MLNYYITQPIKLLVIFQFINIIVVSIFINIFNKNNKFNYTLNKKSQKVVIMIIIWLMAALPVSSLFLIKINLLFNITWIQIIVVLILFIFNTAILLIYFNYIFKNNNNYIYKKNSNNYNQIYIINLIIIINIIYCTIILFII